jgi:hypothetical protein
MPKFRADYEVKSALVLPEGAEPLIIRNSASGCELTIRNAKPDAAGHAPGLIVNVVADCDLIERAPKVFRDVLAQEFDILTFITNAEFSVEQCLRVLEWEPFQKKRRMRPMKKFDPLYPPTPNLAKELAESTERISHSGLPPYVLRALRYFRYGIAERQAEEQFQLFWRAIETIAEGRKDTSPVPIQCPKCGGPLHCAGCQQIPTRRPMANEAMIELLKVRLKDQAIVLFRRLAKARHAITHARPVSAIEADIGGSLGHVVNEAATAAWFSILDSLPKIDGPIQLLHYRDGEFAHGELIAAAEIEFEYPAGAAHPTDDQIPEINIDLIVRFAPVPNQPPLE